MWDVEYFKCDVKCKYPRTMEDVQFKDWRITPKIISFSTAEQTIHAKKRKVNNLKFHALNHSILLLIKSCSVFLIEGPFAAQ